MAGLTGYKYRKKGHVNATVDGAQTDYQKKLLVGESSGAAGEEIDCESHCHDFPNDIRFTGADEQTKHDYWVESITGITPNRLATIWIEVATIPASGDVDFYIYYGKTSDSGESDFDDTFVFGELWDSPTIDSAKWPTISPELTYSINTANHYLEVTDITSGAAWEYKGVGSKALTFPTQFIIEDAYTAGGVSVVNNETIAGYIFQQLFGVAENVSFPVNFTANFMFIDAWNWIARVALYAQIDGGAGQYLFVSAGGWRTAYIRMWKLAGQISIEEGGVVRKTGAHTRSLTHMVLQSSKYTTYPIGNLRYGAFKIRNYASPEPTWGTWGSEEEIAVGKTRSYAFIIG